MARKSGLGKGLDALIPGGAQADEFTPAPFSGPGVVWLPVDGILPNPRQPRTHFEENDLEDLSASIKEHGVIQPLVVTQAEEPGRYILIAGERRLLASRRAGLKEVPAIFREASQQQLVELALVENVQRADLSPLESAEAYRQLTEEFGLSHEDVAQRVGKSRVSVTNTLRLLKLPAMVRQALAEGAITEGHARALLALPSPQAQNAALQSILKNELNVRQTEELVRRLSGQRTAPVARAAIDPDLKELQDKLQERLGTRVDVRHRRKGGTLVVHYYSPEELDHLVERLLGE